MVSFQHPKHVVILGTGGTIAGLSKAVSDNIGYTAAQVGVETLVAGLPGLSDVLMGHELVSEQVAQLDSKDMGFAVWRELAQRVVHHLAQVDVSGVVITHGTDTLEETAYFLQAVLPPQLTQSKAVVLTCAMRPATALAPDGPQNLLDAVSTALTGGARGVVVVCAGTVHSAVDVQKCHTYKLDAFSSGDAGPLAFVEEGQLRMLRDWPSSQRKPGCAAVHDIATGPQTWPRVEIVMSYAGCDGHVVDALLASGARARPLRGLVVAGTGNGTLHADLEAALSRAQQLGVRVVRATRCAQGRVLPTANALFIHSHGLSPVKARIALMLDLMAS